MGRKKKEIVINDSSYVFHSKKSALKKSILEGSMQSVSSNLGSNLITPFALVIGANSFHIGILSSLSSIVGPIGQLWGSKLMEKKPRKKMILEGKSFQNLFWFLILGLIYLSWKGIVTTYLPYLLIILYAFSNLFWGRNQPAWFSWMGDLVFENERGKYFSKRNRIVSFVGLVSFIAGAFLLDYFKTNGYILIGFAILFSLSILFRHISRHILGSIFNPKFRLKKGYYFTFFEFVKKYDNYGKFVFYRASLFFAIMLSAPFFAVYLLEDLGFDYVVFTFVLMSSTIFYLLFTPLAGKFSDKYGNIKLIYVSAFLFPFVPILWIFLKSPLQLIFISGFISGIANAAFIIGVTDFTYDSISPQKRGLAVAYTSLLVGIATFGGSLIGGFLIQYSNISFMKPIFFVFSISSLLMIFASLFFLPQIKEVRKTQRIRGLSINVIHPFKSVGSSIVWFKNFIQSK